MRASPGWTEANAGDRVDIALMQGYLTLPFPPGLPFIIESFMDLDPARSSVRDWTGSTAIRTRHDAQQGPVSDNHPGTDFAFGPDAMMEDVEVYAAAPGIVSELFAPPAGSPKGGFLMMQEPDGRLVSYEHLGTILVDRGEAIARGKLLGRTSVGWDQPHLHLQLHDRSGSAAALYGESLDLYRDPRDPSSLGFWTQDNAPQYAGRYAR